MHYVGVDLGATNIRAVVGDEDAAVVGSARGKTPNGPTGSAVTDAVVRTIREACADASVTPATIRGAGIAAIGELDGAAGVAKNLSNLPEEVGSIQLVDPISELLETDHISLSSDTLAGAIGERYYTHPEAENLIYLTISSGIGAGVIADGKAFRGKNGNAGEIGHMTIDANGRMTCGCGRAGHWEAYCAGNNIPRFARTLFEENPVETTVPIDRDDFTAAHLFEEAGKDDFADEVIDRLAQLNTMGIANLIYAYAPSVICLGGAVALNNPELVVDPIRDRLDDVVFVDAPEVALSELGDHAVVNGALVSALTAGSLRSPSDEATGMVEA